MSAQTDSSYYEAYAAQERLVAAAPDLLAALQSLHRLCRDLDLENEGERPTEEQFCQWMDAAEAALTKATGRSP